MTAIHNEVTLQMYGDPVLQERIVFLLNHAMNADCSESATKPYTTKRGKEGTFRTVTVKLN